ncbi:MAG: hypothetical protein NC181_03745 [Clostridium sp.]|nr:hypothetical protein [Clostridium sp.]MCM1444266.1 hypothetical protein [Candidatus Amulumruptor caecigallinarius]
MIKTKILDNYKSDIYNNKKLTSKYSLEDIISLLLNENISDFLTALDSYLEDIGNKNLEFLVVDLIKISLLENDQKFIKPIQFLKFISIPGITYLDVNTKRYIVGFNKAIQNKQSKKAKVYLDIIAKLNLFGTSFLFDGIESLACIDNEDDISFDKQKSYKDIDYMLYNYEGVFIEDISYLLGYNSNILSILDSLKFTKSEKCIFYIMLAKEYYCRKNYYKGDKYLSIVKELNSKNNLVIYLLNEIRNDKKHTYKEEYKTFDLSSKKAH